MRISLSTCGTGAKIRGLSAFESLRGRNMLSKIRHLVGCLQAICLD